jgi:hypothetical protein
MFRPTKVLLGLVIAALMGALVSVDAGSVGAATTMKENEAFAMAQLLKLSNLPHGWQKGGQVWHGPSEDSNASSILTNHAVSQAVGLSRREPSAQRDRGRGEQSVLQQQRPEHEHRHPPGAIDG